MSFDSAPKREPTDVDTRLGEDLRGVVEQLRNLRERLGPFLEPSPLGDPECLKDAALPAMSPLEERIVWLGGRVMEADEIIKDINSRLYIPTTIDPSVAKIDSSC